jgi:hypothetical protein
MPASISVQRLYHPAVLEFDAAECHHEGVFRQHLVRQHRDGTDRRMHGVTQRCDIDGVPNNGSLSPVRAGPPPTNGRSAERRAHRFAVEQISCC